MKSDQKEAKRCYENSLKTKRGVCAVTTQSLREELMEEGQAQSHIKRQEPRHEHPKPNQERLGQSEERLAQGGASKGRASRRKGRASRTYY